MKYLIIFFIVLKFASLSISFLNSFTSYYSPKYFIKQSNIDNTTQKNKKEVRRKVFNPRFVQKHEKQNTQY